MLINLTLGEHLQILGERRGVCTKVVFNDTKPVIPLKRSSLNTAKLTTQCLQKLLYGPSTGYKSGNLAESNFFIASIWHTSCRSVTKFGNDGGLSSRHLFPEFRELWSRGPGAPARFQARVGKDF